MDRVEKRVLIDAPVSAVFHFANEPFNLLRICPTIVEITDVERNRNGGRNFRCVSKMADVRILYTCECTEHVVDRSIGYKISGGLRGVARWQFEPQMESTTEVSIVFEYEPPLPLLKHHAQSELLQRNAYDAQQLLHNLKLLLEKQAAVQA